MDLALNNLQRMICHETQTINQINQYKSFVRTQCSGYKCWYLTLIILFIKTQSFAGVVLVVTAMDCGIVVREFVLQSRYYLHFRANTLGKGMNPLILPAMG